MSARRKKKSLLEDDDIVLIESPRDEGAESGGDICVCWHTRERHGEHGKCLAACRCERFVRMP